MSDAPLSRSECTDDECGGAEDENNILDAMLTCVVHQIVLVGLGRQHYPAKPAGQVGRKRHKNVLRSNPGPTLHVSSSVTVQSVWFCSTYDSPHSQCTFAIRPKACTESNPE